MDQQLPREHRHQHRIEDPHFLSATKQQFVNLEHTFLHLLHDQSPRCLV